MSGIFRYFATCFAVLTLQTENMELQKKLTEAEKSCEKLNSFISKQQQELQQLRSQFSKKVCNSLSCVPLCALICKCTHVCDEGCLFMFCRFGGGDFLQQTVVRKDDIQKLQLHNCLTLIQDLKPSVVVTNSYQEGTETKQMLNYYSAPPPPHPNPLPPPKFVLLSF